jgi:hypothetical protein
VQVKVNGVKMDFVLELGQYGSAFFAHEQQDGGSSDEEDDVFEGAPTLGILHGSQVQAHDACSPHVRVQMQTWMTTAWACCPLWQRTRPTT